jgi:tetratricopeptide (TPR) repeat protein
MRSVPVVFRVSRVWQQLGDPMRIVRQEGSSNSGPECAGDRVAVLVPNGENWEVGYAGRTISLKASKGLAYIYRLLQHPNQEFHALDLLSGPGTNFVPESATSETSSTDSTLTIGRLGDAGEMLDRKAKQDYKRRLSELNEELEDQRERGNSARAAEIESETAFLIREISRAVGLGGRDRRAGSAAERARLNVTRAIKTALQKISEHQAELGEILERCVRTGLFCCFMADPRVPMTWQFSLEGIKASFEATEATAPYLLRGETDFLRVFVDQTKFVGREEERGTMRRCLEQTLLSQGRVLMIGGQPGVGKTRIAREFGAEAAQRGFLTLAGGCYDREDSVAFSPFVEILETLAQSPNQAAFRSALGPDAAELTRLMPQLRRIFPDIPKPLELSPDQSRESRRLLFNAFREFLARNARDRPVLLLMEDLQWADEGTLSLINYLARSVAELPVMLVGTYRDEVVDATGLLVRTLDELNRLHLPERMNLHGLPQNAVAEMIRSLSGRDPPTPVVTLIYSNTEGNPFFVEELYRHLVEQGKLMDSNGDFLRDLKLADIDVPNNLRLAIGRRLARLGGETQKILGTAAVIGRSFSFDLLEASTGVNADILLDRVEEAEKAGVISSTLQFPEARFQFSHELIRKAVLADLFAPRRQRLHLQIAEAIERIYAGALEERVNDFAHHLLQAGVAADGSKTIRYLSMAARRARLQGALTETVEFYRDALQVLKRMPENTERDQLELGLQLSIGAVSMATRGYADKETALAYQRATSLGERLGDPTQVVLALTGLVTQPLLRGELDTALAIADQALAVCKRHGKTKTQIWGHHIEGVVHYHSGHFATAWDHLSKAQAEYREEEHKKNPQDPGSEVLQYMALTAWQLGMADTARQRMREAIDLSDRLQKPFELARCSFYAGFLHALMQDPGPAKEFSEKAMRWASEYSISLFFDASRIVYGWAIAKQGHGAEGVACARAAIESFKAADNRLGIATYLGFLAEALLTEGLPEEAMVAVEEGLTLPSQEPMDISYLWWLRGKLFLENTYSAATPQILRLDKSSLEEAEKSFRTALSLATNIGAKSYAMRSATSLGRLLAARGMVAEARALVEPLLKNMTEGFDTRDLVDAMQLVEDLS